MGDPLICHGTIHRDRKKGIKKNLKKSINYYKYYLWNPNNKIDYN